MLCEGLGRNRMPTSRETIRAITCGWVLSCTLYCGGLGAQSFELERLETDDMRLIYSDPLQTYLVPHVVRSFHNSMEFQRYIFDWTPWEKSSVLLTDFSDYGNARAGSVPFNFVQVDIAPLSRTFETFPASERIYMLMNHELVHLATGDVWNEQDAWWRRAFFGKPAPSQEHPETLLYAYLAAPRDVAPRWYFEGSAVFMETWMSGGLGRAQGAFDEMVFRAKVRDGAQFYSNLGLVSEGTRIDFMAGTNAYLYGTRFMSYLAWMYAPQAVIEWLKRGADSERYYADQFHAVFGKPLEAAWNEWIEWEHGFQQANLEAVRQYPLTEVRRLTSTGLGSISRSFFDPDTNTLIGGFMYPGVVAHIGVLSAADGSIKRLTDIKGPMKYRVTATAWDPLGRTLFYTTDNAGYRDLVALDVDTGKKRVLLKDARIGDIAFNRADQSIWGLRHLNGYVTLVRIPPPYDAWSQVYTWPYGSEPFELDVAPDGTLLSASVAEISGQQFLRVFSTTDLLTGTASPVAEFNFGTAIPEGFVFSPDGRYLFGSSYYTGVSNIFRYEIATQEIEGVSNAETGFFRPIPLEDGSLIVFEFTGEGWVPAVLDPEPLEDLSAITFLGNEIVKKYPVVREWSLTRKLDEFDLESVVTERGKFNPNRGLELTSAYPIIEGYRDTFALGYNWMFHNTFALSSVQANLSYSLDGSISSSERLHADIEYRGIYWNLRYWHNNADFYDLFGPTERSRKGDAVIGGYRRSLIFDEPRHLDFEAEVGWYTGLDTLPGNQNVASDFEDLLSVSAELNYSHTKKSLGAVDHEKGWRWKLGAYADHANGETFPRFLAGIDFGFALPLKHASVWFYNAAGVADGARNESLANWYFGAFGNNYVDDREIRRYREPYSFPGFELDEISGQDFFRSVLELNLPPIRFEEVGAPSFYLQDLRAALFAGGLVTDAGDSLFEETWSTIGIQVDLAFTIVHRLPMTLSFGFAQGYIDGKKWDEEWMISLKIL